MATIDQQFVEYIVKTLVNNPEKVAVERKIDEKGVLLSLTVDPEDVGRVIGKRGVTAQAIRVLLRALGTKQDARYNLKIVNTDEGKKSEEETPTEEEVAEDEDSVVSEEEAEDNEEEPDEEDEEADEDEDEDDDDEDEEDEEEEEEDEDEDEEDEDDDEDAEDEEETSELAEKTRAELADLDDLDI